MKQLYAELVTLGFTGSYARAAAFARQWNAGRQREQQTTGRGTFVSLHFDPGDAFPFDWSEYFAVLGGLRADVIRIDSTAALRGARVAGRLSL